MALSEVDRIRMLEAIAQDMDLKATQRLRALEELGRIESRKSPRVAVNTAPEGRRDPMADGDELEVVRRRRARSAAR